MEQKNVYIALEQSILVQNKDVCLEDIATVFCIDKDINTGIRKLKLFHFTKNDTDYTVISAMKLIETINIAYKDVQITNIGSPETVVYYRNTTASQKYNQTIKAILLMLLTFFGTAYSIMSYNGDVGSDQLLQRLYLLFTGHDVALTSTALLPGIISYSLGLGLGMIVFFNHGLNHNSKNDPTPLQVQMRQYEKEVNDSIIVDSGRKGTMIDAD